MQRPAPRLTVGPLPPSVYWRRRAIVLVGVVVAVVLVWLAVGGGSPSSPTAVSSEPASRTTSTPGPTTAAPTVGTPTPGDLTSPSFVPATPEQTGPAATPRSPAPANVAPCTDDQITVTVAASPSPGLLGGTFTFSIAIVSKATDWCSRDLGAGAQEIRVLREGSLVFTSDECGSARTSDVRAFAVGDAVTYRYSWSSYRATPRCALASSPAPPGKYQVVARIGTKVSAPVDFTINR
ncbi:hypothetical protein [Dactylosporangium salmoneum]|uniref:Uncharacterized protein n=1 Tax=Dactylosporangium salmoneum TaxID=53361 RepID=A0ABN3FAY6_9ACTN